MYFCYDVFRGTQQCPTPVITADRRNLFNYFGSYSLVALRLGGNNKDANNDSTEKERHHHHERRHHRHLNIETSSWCHQLQCDDQAAMQTKKEERKTEISHISSIHILVGKFAKGPCHCLTISIISAPLQFEGVLA